MNISDAWDITELEGKVRFWKERAEKAEAELAQLRAQIIKLETERKENTNGK